MARVVSIWSYLCVTPGSWQSQNRVLWIVEGMNYVVCRARMVRILPNEIERYGTSAHLAAEPFVARADRSKQRKSVEGSSLPIVRIGLINLLHGFRVGDVTGEFIAFS